LGPSPGIQQHADQEQIDQALALFRVVDFLRPCRQKMRDPVPSTDPEMLVPAVWRDARERRIVVALRTLPG
jgi:hypothetical protein